ncbi:hypothetical protein K2173_021397 [Erythroxylum novogranatense]|uniref:Red chlorophyll catabolite reductase n=1 Tax=Erythroxylum novogranatense TaxID=1862640 RepID=A0AAV8TX54_9ROSI|nr:hypothetical protein K2173_021397 [Erythroxylum novogranatense]
MSRELMAVRLCSILPSTSLSFPSHFTSPVTSTRVRSLKPHIRATSSPAMEMHGSGRDKFLEYPFVSAPHRDMMIDLISMVEDRLGSQLLPCSLPIDAQYCQNENGTAQASLHIRSGHGSSLVDFILGSWLHCKLPTGASLNITSLLAYLNLSTDAPNFVAEVIQGSPTSLVFLLDLPPRKDLVMHPDYLQTFYENTQLDTHRQMLAKLPEVQPYISSSLYLRHYFSPTAILIRIEVKADESGQMEDIIKSHLNPIAKEVLRIWLDHCACGGREVGEEEKTYLKKRDNMMKNKSIEIDLGSNFPRLFGPEVANRVLGAIREVYNV